MNSFLKKHWPVGALLLVWFIFASPYFLNGLVPFPSKYLVTFFPPWNAEYGMPVKNNAMPDVITQIYPWKKITIESWRLGQVPLWNPYSFSGTPHLANYQTAVLSPLNLLYAFLPFLDAWSVSILLQPLFAGAFMYILLRCLDRSREASLIGSIAFMFCGFLTVWMAYGTLGWAVLWLPLLFALIITHVGNRTWWKPVLVAGSVAWSFVSGHFQMSVYVVASTVCFIFSLGTQKKYWRALAELGAGVSFGVLLAAPQILPSLEAYRNSVRSELFTQVGGISWQYLVTIFAPDFYGNPVTRNDWYGFYAEWASFIGVIPLLSATYALVRRVKGVGFFAAWGFIALLIATSSPANALLIGLKIPAISTSYAARSIVLVSFSLAVMSAFGIDTLRGEWERKRVRRFARFAIGVVLFLIVLWVVVLVMRPFDADRIAIAKRNLVLPTSIALAFCLFGFFGFARRRDSSYVVMLVFIVLTAGDLLRYARKWMPFDPRQYVYPQNNTISFLQAQTGSDRIVGNLGGEVTNGFSLFGIEGYDALYQKRYGEFLQSTADGTLAPPQRSVVRLPRRGKFTERALQLLGVQYVVHRSSDGRFEWAYPYWQYPHYTRVYRDAHYDVFRNGNALPRVFLAESFIVRTNPQEILDALYTVDRRETVVLESEPEIPPAQGEGTAEFVRYTPNEVIVRTRSPSPKILFLSDVYDSGWKAIVDGKAARVHRANFDFRAVSVPAGDHTVRFIYWPQSFTYGLWIAVASLAALTGMAFRLKRRL